MNRFNFFCLPLLSLTSKHKCFRSLESASEQLQLKYIFKTNKWKQWFAVFISVLALCKSEGVCQTAFDKLLLSIQFFYVKVFQKLIGQVGSYEFFLRAWDDTSSEMKQWSGIGTSHQWNYTVLTSMAAFHPCKESEIPGKVLSSSATSNE